MDSRTIPVADDTEQLEPGVIFTDDRDTDDTTYILDYIDPDGGVIFIDTTGDDRRDEVYHYEPYLSFVSNVGNGRYNIQRDESGQPMYGGRLGRLREMKSTYEESGGRTAAHKAAAIDEALQVLNGETPDDYTEPVEFTTVRGVGEKAAQALRDRNIETRGDVRNLTVEELCEIPYMGEKNSQRLLDHVTRS